MIFITQQTSCAHGKQQRRFKRAKNQGLRDLRHAKNSPLHSQSHARRQIKIIKKHPLTVRDSIGAWLDGYFARLVAAVLSA